MATVSTSAASAHLPREIKDLVIGNVSPRRVHADGLSEMAHRHNVLLSTVLTDRWADLAPRRPMQSRQGFQELECRSQPEALCGSLYHHA